MSVVCIKSSNHGYTVHFWDDGAIDGKPVSQTEYLPLGHEAVGSVFTVGDKVEHLKVGDRVAVEPATPCRVCIRCREGLYNLCPNIRFAGSSTADPACLAKFYKAQADFCYKLPDHITWEERAMIEPLAVAAHSVMMIGIKLGQGLVIFGAGTIGLVCEAVVKMFGARGIVSVDILDHKLDFAKRFLNSHTYKSTADKSPEETAADIIRQAELGQGADAVIEASGSAICTNTAVHVLRKGGQFVQTGIGKHVIDFPIFQFSIKELHMHGAFRHGEGDFRLAIDALQHSLIPVKDLISQLYDFEDTETALGATLKGQGIKNMVQGPR
ncbi:uncharacterized protein PV07_12509 [Cladophialophora immunda]|uniref:D-xylulose reductase n=1 Tax=Cladophialophora immunda TaxID=569365 RepID=A0A0D2ABF7_9EURO|nr:uncharacterized protein PV07_12509 [Cladophialophora immunda]KIW22092.1 hypothetical protein PV07_12509 [Cladophialophora immunda]